MPEDLVGLKMNLQESNLKNLLEALPRSEIHNFTLGPVWVGCCRDSDREKIVREIIPKLKALGAEG